MCPFRMGCLRAKDESFEARAEALENLFKLKLVKLQVGGRYWGMDKAVKSCLPLKTS